MSDNDSKGRITIYDGSFWDLWFQKIFRNIASVKYQFMVAFFTIVTAGMFFVSIDGVPLISPSLGLGFLGGGFVALATSRIYIRTKLTDADEEEEHDRKLRKLDTDS